MAIKDPRNKSPLFFASFPGFFDVRKAMRAGSQKQQLCGINSNAKQSIVSVFSEKQQSD
jgi:hypothetical protein